MPATIRAAALPDAPTPARVSADPQQSADQYPRTQQIPVHTHPGPAPRLAKYIEPDQHAATLTSKDKLELSVWEQVQPYAVGTEIMAAGWEHLLNSNPHYGSDKAGFGERLGAAAIRQTSQAVFSDGVFAALLHQDPRYYRKGSGSIAGRIVYSATRVIITRTDAGNEAPNYSQMLGYAGASALTMTYYPGRQRHMVQYHGRLCDLPRGICAGESGPRIRTGFNPSFTPASAIDRISVEESCRS